MARQKQSMPRNLVAAQKAMERWRATRTQRAIPEALWEAAVALAREHGVHRTSRALRLNYDRLRRRLAQAPRSPSPRQRGVSAPAAAGFAEVVRARAGATTRLVDDECVVEFENAHGDRVRVRTRGLPDLDALAASVWSGRQR